MDQWNDSRSPERKKRRSDSGSPKRRGDHSWNRDRHRREQDLQYRRQHGAKSYDKYQRIPSSPARRRLSRSRSPPRRRSRWDKKSTSSAARTVKEERPRRESGRRTRDLPYEERPWKSDVSVPASRQRPAKSGSARGKDLANWNESLEADVAVVSSPPKLTRKLSGEKNKDVQVNSMPQFPFEDVKGSQPWCLDEIFEKQTVWLEKKKMEIQNRLQQELKKKRAAKAAAVKFSHDLPAAGAAKLFPDRTDWRVAGPSAVDSASQQVSPQQPLYPFWPPAPTTFLGVPPASSVQPPAGTFSRMPFSMQYPAERPMVSSGQPSSWIPVKAGVFQSESGAWPPCAMDSQSSASADLSQEQQTRKSKNKRIIEQLTEIAKFVQRTDCPSEVGDEINQLLDLVAFVQADQPRPSSFTSANFDADIIRSLLEVRFDEILSNLQASAPPPSSQPRLPAHTTWKPVADVSAVPISRQLPLLVRMLSAVEPSSQKGEHQTSAKVYGQSDDVIATEPRSPRRLRSRSRSQRRRSRSRSRSHHRRRRSRSRGHRSRSRSRRSRSRSRRRSRSSSRSRRRSRSRSRLSSSRLRRSPSRGRCRRRSRSYSRHGHDRPPQPSGLAMDSTVLEQAAAAFLEVLQNAVSK